MQVTDSLKVLESTTGADGAALKAVMERAVADSSYVEEKGQKLPGFRYLSAAEANKIVAERRKQVGGKGKMAAHEKSVYVCEGGGALYHHDSRRSCDSAQQGPGTAQMDQAAKGIPDPAGSGTMHSINESILLG